MCLALTEDFNLVVVKIFYDDSLCEKECDVWSRIYGVTVLCVRLLHSQCLIMPFVFQCIEHEGSINFDFDVSNWSRVPSSGLLSDQRFDAWTTKIAEFMNSSDITVSKALDEAIEELAKNRLVHDDLEWRHVALLPVLHDNEVVGMKSVLIDLATVKVVESEEAAREIMQKVKQNYLISNQI